MTEAPTGCVVNGNWVCCQGHICDTSVSSVASVALHACYYFRHSFLSSLASLLPSLLASLLPSLLASLLLSLLASLLLSLLASLLPSLLAGLLLVSLVSFIRLLLATLLAMTEFRNLLLAFGREHFCLCRKKNKVWICLMEVAIWIK